LLSTPRRRIVRPNHKRDPARRCACGWKQPPNQQLIYVEAAATRPRYRRGRCVMTDDPEFLWRLARRCRELASRTSIEHVRHHLLIMADELEAQGEDAERGSGREQNTA